MNHPFQPGLYVSIYCHPYQIGVRIREVTEYPEAEAVLLTWEWRDIVSIVPEKNTRKGFYGCHVLLGRGVADYAVHEKLSFATGLARPTMIFVGTEHYYTLDYPVSPEAGHDHQVLLAQLRMHALAEREIIRAWNVPTREVGGAND